MSTDTSDPSHPEQDHQIWTPSVNPWIVAFSVMLATFMVVLDSSVANVALPHIAGDLSASTDESTWVLTSYLVANAVMLPASGWLARRIGRKRLLLLSIITFTVASLFCGIAANMPLLILARVLQGFGGGGMMPLAQSILLESFPPRQHGTAMAVYGAGVVVAPVIGPTLGGWITDSYSWRWIFYINLPIGLLALFMVNLYVEDPPYIHNAVRGAIDYLGFSFMALWLGSLQLVLDKGQESDWFSASWICWTACISLAAMVGFIVREFRTSDPIVQLRALRERNFFVGNLITGLFGAILYGLTAMLPLFLQTLMGYSALSSGLSVSPRGIGSLVAMAVVAVLLRYVDGRYVLFCGFALLGYSTFLLSHINFDISMWSVVWPNFLNGFAGGCIFVPLTTLSMAYLRKQDMGNATGIYNLMRNIGGSIGIACITTILVRGAQIHQNYLSAGLTPSSPATQNALRALTARMMQSGLAPADAAHKAMGMLYGGLQQQAALLSYADDFRLLGYLCLLCAPLVLLFRRASHHTGEDNIILGE